MRLGLLEVVPRRQGISWGCCVCGLLSLMWRRLLPKLPCHLPRWERQGGRTADYHGWWQDRREDSFLSLWLRFVACRKSTDCHPMNICEWRVLEPNGAYGTYGRLKWMWARRLPRLECRYLAKRYIAIVQEIIWVWEPTLKDPTHCFFSGFDDGGPLCLGNEIETADSNMAVSSLILDYGMGECKEEG